MNKETIIKYKTEFDHYLNGGSLLWCRARDRIKVWTVAKDSHTDFFNTNDSYYIYVINDEYVEFRKALAEGKTIQRRNGYGCEWKDSGEQDMLNYSIVNLRIKPEEPQFKVGDWVRNNSTGDIFEYTNDILKPDSSCCELWNPEPNEYCWFYKRGSNNPVFAKFVRNIDSNLGSYEAVGFIPNGPRASDEEQFGYFERCKPFIGTLPDGLKDKHEMD